MRVLLLALLVGACATSQVPAVAPVVRAVRPVLPAVEGAWSFSTATGSCTARVGQGGLSLTIHAVAGTVGFQLQPAGGAAFNGPAGNWRLRRDEPAQPAERSAPRLRALLAGGLLTPEGRRLAPLRVPDAGPSGREWFGCLAGLTAV